MRAAGEAEGVALCERSRIGCARVCSRFVTCPTLHEAFLNHAVIDSLHVEQQFNDALGIRPLVRIPGHYLDKAIVERNARRAIDDAGAPVIRKVAAADAIVAEPELACKGSAHGRVA